jgi:hypothetical protein
VNQTPESFLDNPPSLTNMRKAVFPGSVGPVSIRTGNY